MNEIEIYTSPDNQIELKVQFDKDTVWLDAHQIGALFDVNRPAIVKHIHNIYKTNELIEGSTCSILEQVAADGKRRKMNRYNLDVIISVGYRVNSARATQFRQWASKRLKEYLLNDYLLNEKRLNQVLQNMHQLEQAVVAIKQLGNSEQIQLTEAKGLLDIITNYTQSFILLNQFDCNNLQADNLSENITYEIRYADATVAIAELKKQLITTKQASSLFGNPKDDSFKSILGNIVQTFEAHYLYIQVLRSRRQIYCT